MLQCSDRERWYIGDNILEQVSKMSLNHAVRSKIYFFGLTVNLRITGYSTKETLIGDIGF